MTASYTRKLTPDAKRVIASSFKDLLQSRKTQNQIGETYGEAIIGLLRRTTKPESRAKVLQKSILFESLAPRNTPRYHNVSG